MNRVVIAETLRRQTSIAAIIYVVFIVGMMLLSIDVNAPGHVWRPLFALLVIISAAQLIGPEFSSGSLQLVLAKPINRSVYLISRVIGAVLFLWICIWLLVAIEAVAIRAWSDAAAIGLNVSAKTLLVCSLFAFFGSFSRAYFNVAYYFFLQLFLNALPSLLHMLTLKTVGFAGWVGGIIRDHPGIIRGIAWIHHNLFPDEPLSFDRDWLLLVLSNAAIAILLAALIFRRREVPYGAD